MTEGQIFSVFILTFISMCFLRIWNNQHNLTLDCNGLFLFHTFTLTLLLTAAWSIYLWNDEILRKKYPGLIYIPEPWAFYSLYLQSKSAG